MVCAEALQTKGLVAFVAVGFDHCYELFDAAEDAAA